MKQKEVFVKSEGDKWYERNASKLTLKESKKNDPILECLNLLKPSLGNVLEIGCSNGWRLHKLREKYGALSCTGVDPSAMAIKKGRKNYPEISLRKGTADKIPFKNNRFETVIAGFCLYLCDREDLFKIAYEIDRLLKDKGLLLILDFHPPFAYQNEYAHHPGMYSYKMDYSRLFSWNPNYSTVFQYVHDHKEFTIGAPPDDRISVTVLHKDSRQAYPVNPFKKS